MQKTKLLPEVAANNQTQTRLLSRDEVEQTFGISKRFLELAAGQGGGPAFVKVGRLTRYRICDLLEWIERNRFENTTQAAQRNRGAK